MPHEQMIIPSTTSAPLERGPGASTIAPWPLVRGIYERLTAPELLQCSLKKMPTRPSIPSSGPSVQNISLQEGGGLRSPQQLLWAISTAAAHELMKECGCGVGKNSIAHGEGGNGES
ncbi:hypothetical protein RRG08_061284 [Elysia crispata]|uniref:Uncharacterized protein n=1 Tax=Elysia crispata TaxID=231223 RepID=A0AAE1CXF0_9GAST|nr:hypothetical protein RRG08_061284 [Elysia crispata]